MSERWFRAYEGAVDDPKLRRLSDATFRGLFHLWCLASRNAGVLPGIADMAFSLRMTESKVAALLKTLKDAGLLDADETGTRPHNWNGRQYKSDVSTERVKRHRERHKTVSGNVSPSLHETPPDTETEPEAETERESSPRALPISPDWKPKDPKADPAEVKRFVNHYLAKGHLMVDWDAAWEVWLSRIADFGKAKAMPLESTAPPADVVWLDENDPRFGKVAGTHRQRTGKPLIPTTSKHGSGFGAWLKPADYPELSTPTP